MLYSRKWSVVILHAYLGLACRSPKEPFIRYSQVRLHFFRIESSVLKSQVTE